MKKIISTVLVAAAFAVVSNVDAKVTRYQQQVEQSMEQPMTPKQQRKGRVKPMVEPASKPQEQNLTNAIDKTLANPTEANKKGVMAALQPATMTEDERELAVLTFQEEDTMKRLAFRRAELKSMSGWFDFLSVTAEKKTKKARIKALISSLEKDLVSIRADIASLKPRVSRTWYDTMKTAAKGLGILGLLGGAIYALDMYTEGGVTTRVQNTGTFVGETYRKYAPTSLGGSSTGK